VAIDIPSLQVALMSGDSSEREDAVDALGESRRLEAVPLLRLALKDADEDVREAAIDADNNRT
jgi:HEAT repeat protein